MAPSDRQLFTFIDHDDDLTSKRIKDAKARKAIRSHVMRDVRRRERLAGVKRTSRREGRAATATKQSASKLREAPESASNKRKLPLRPGSSAAPPAPELDVVKSKSQRPVAWVTERWPSNRMVSPTAVPGSWMLDPFCTLPGASEVPSMVERLLYHCKSPDSLSYMYNALLDTSLDPLSATVYRTLSRYIHIGIKSEKFQYATAAALVGLDPRLHGTDMPCDLSWLLLPDTRALNLQRFFNVFPFTFVRHLTKIRLESVLHLLLSEVEGPGMRIPYRSFLSRRLHYNFKKARSSSSR